MKIKKEKVHEDFNRDLYWVKIHFYSDDGKKESIILACASQEYLWNEYGEMKPSLEILNKWADKVINKWNEFGEKILDTKIYYDVYATSDEGRENGLEFLKNKIK